MGTVDRELDDLEVDNEIEDARYNNLSRKQRRKVLEQAMGKKEVARQIADGMLSLGKKSIDYISSRRVKSDTVSALHGTGNASRIKELNDPSKWRR